MPAQTSTPFTTHPRDYRDFRFIYPVISRRARGLSLGINLNPDKVCNWDCLYCQVDRSTPGRDRTVDEAVLVQELAQLLADTTSGALWQMPRFASTPQSHRVVRDVAMAGDGEPTSYPGFERVVRSVAQLLRDTKTTDIPIRVLTNASLFHLPAVKRGLEALAEHKSEVWCKLDAGTEGYFKLVDRSAFSLEHCQRNIEMLAQTRPITIQSLFMRIDGEPPDTEEIAAWSARVARIATAGSVELVQVHTIARRPASSRCTPLALSELEGIAAQVRGNRPELKVDVFGGVEA